MNVSLACIMGAKVVPPYTPVGEPSNVAWYEADQALGLSGADVSGWGDAALRGLTFVPVAPAGPTYVEDAGDGYPVAAFNGTTQGLWCAAWGAIDLELDWTFATLIKRTGTTDGIFLSYGDHADNLGRMHHRMHSGVAPVGTELGMISQLPSSNDIAGPATFGGWNIMWAQRRGGAYYASVDEGSEVSLSVPAGTYNPAKLFLGAGRASGSIALPTTCQIRAAAMFQSGLGAPGATPRLALRNYWASKWPGVP